MSYFRFWPSGKPTNSIVNIRPIPGKCKFRRGGLIGFPRDIMFVKILRRPPLVHYGQSEYEPYTNEALNEIEVDDLDNEGKTQVQY